MTGKTDIGRLLDLSVLSPSLKIRVTLANFHESGKRLVSMEVLNKKASEFSIKGSASFFFYQD